MAISSKSKVRDILKSPEACAVMEKYMPGFSTNNEVLERLTPVMGMKMEKVLSFPQVPVDEDAKAKILAELDALK